MATPKVCIYCNELVEAGAPRAWFGLGLFAHEDCADAIEQELAPREDARRRFA